MSYDKFLFDYANNTKYEIEAGRRIEKHFNNNVVKYTDKNDYKKCKYDFITNDNIKFEVKKHHQTNKYKNMCIEYEAYKKPSGIMTTQANFYINIDQNENYYLIDVSTLLSLSKKYGIPKKCGDGLNCKGLFVNINYIIENSTSI
jgi:hypothetical protein